MKSKQATLIAKFGEQKDNAKNMSQDKETVSRFLVIDKKTEKRIVDCRVYMGRSSSASTVYASIWVNAKLKDGREFWTSGNGSAGGYGYHKESAAVQFAISSASIELYGSPYVNREDVDMKKLAHIDGCGSSAVESALLAIAYAAGSKDVIFVSI